jgi:hypothetical protein
MKKYFVFIFLMLLLVCGCEINKRMVLKHIDTTDPKLICQYVENMHEYYFKERMIFDYDSIREYNYADKNKTILIYAKCKNQRYIITINIDNKCYDVHYSSLEEQQ